MLSGHVTQGRQVIRKLLVGSIRLFPNQQVGRGYRFEATVSFGRFLQGFIDPTSVASPTGTALALAAEITLTWDLAA